MVSADVLVLLSDVDGLYTGDPGEDADAAHIPVITAITPDISAMASGANEASGVGSGGMATKLVAARIAQEAGCATIITLGNRPEPLMALESGARASWILATETPANARKSWLKGHIQAEGTLTIDAGAIKALQDGASLLPVGVLAVSGHFERGAILSVQDEAGTAIATGISSYSAANIALIAGRQSDEIDAILGRTARRPAILHRNDLVLKH